jgi:VCBS repeat-containing protein
MTLNITPVNDSPVAPNDAVTTNEDTVLNGNVLANNGSGADSDVDGDTLTITQVNNSTANLDTQITLASGALLTVNANGTFNYNPNGKFEVLKAVETATENFTYTVSDGNGGTDTATVTITINGVNDAPNAVNDNYNTNEDAILTVNAANGVLSNDNDVEGDVLSATLNNSPTNGSLNFNPDGSFTYTPNANFNGTDSFTYQVNDGNGGTGTATVRLTINPVNDDPTVTKEIPDQTATENKGFSFTFAADTFSDIDVGDTLTYSATLENGNPLPSWLSFNGNSRTFSGTPINSDRGILNVKVTASDSQSATASDIFVLTVSNAISGDDTDNILSGTPGADSINGFGGNDRIDGLAGNDSIDGGTGNFDRLFGGDGDDTIIDPDGILGAHGGVGNDTISVTFAASWDNDNNPKSSPRSDGKITGGYGDDSITVTMNKNNFFINLKADEPTSNTPQDGNDVITLLGSYANSVVDLGGGNDTFNGGSGGDNVSGGNGNDTIIGMGGGDRLAGGNGNDTLTGGAGNDNLTGGSGQDFFTFNSPNDKVDSITDFNPVDDTILVDDVGFGGGLVVGALLEAQFVLGTTATDASDRFIYNQSTGALFFDIDGTGASTQIQIATLTTKPVIGFNDIFVI